MGVTATGTSTQGASPVLTLKKNIVIVKNRLEYLDKNNFNI